MVGLNVLSLLNMITYAHFILLIFEFKPNFTFKYFINSIINQVFDQFRFKSRLYITPMNPSFESDEFGHTNLKIKCPHAHFLTGFDENMIMVQIF